MSRIPVIISFVVSFLFLPLVAQTPKNWEVPPVFKASEHLPPAFLQGPHHRVRESAPSDGYLIHYTIDSDFGTFKCAGRRDLEVRVAEIGAIAKLVDVSKGDLFAEGLKRSIEKPIDAVKNIVEKPEESIKQVPKTVGHFLGKVGSSIGNAAKRTSERFNKEDGENNTGEAIADTGKELGGAAKSVAGFDKAKLETARQLNVDPYSDNQRLQEEIEKVTWAFFAGGLPLRIGAAVASAGASTALTATTTVGLPSEIYDTTPGELALRDRRALTEMGVAEKTIDEVFLDPALTISLRHEIIGAISQLPAGEGQKAMVEAALSCELRRQTIFLRDALEILVERHRKKPYASLATTGRLPVGVTSEGDSEVPAPVDYISWTSEIAEFATRDTAPKGPRRLLLGGNVSPTAATGLREAGWELAQ